MSNVQSVAVARSWLDPEVAAKRSAHHGLMVDGQIYSSAYQALKALGINSKHHIKWRITFKDLVDRQTGVLVKGYPMPDGSHRDVMLTEPGASTATVVNAFAFADIDAGAAYLPSDFRPESTVTWEPKAEQAAREWCERRELDPHRDGWVYLMREVGDLAGQFKVGLSDDVERRQVELTQGRPWEIVKTKGPMPYWQARSLEAAVLDQIKQEQPQAHLMGEFFQLDERALDHALGQMDIQLLRRRRTG